MKILLFATPAFYNTVKGQATLYNGGGWMFALQKELRKRKDIELAVCFQNTYTKRWEKETQDGIIYYPFAAHNKNFFNKIIDIIKYKDTSRDCICWPHYINIFNEIINDYHPDIIHVFGSETYNQLAPLATKDCPLVLHLQGILSLYIYSYLIPGVSACSFILQDLSLKKIFNRFQEVIYWKRDVYREKKILQSTHYFLGRTHWDKHAIDIINPKAKYYYGGEMLRDIFYLPSKRLLPSKTTIITTSSKQLYKGYDVILKIANILKKETALNFSWKVYGNVDPSYIEHLTGIKHKEVNVELCGIASADQIKEELLTSTMYVQPSYIENSPNSVAEAQILGVPVIASSVGGTSSMVTHEIDGYLFPVTDPYMAVAFILKLANDVELNATMGAKGKETALKKHDKNNVVSTLIETYNMILDDYKYNHSKNS